MNHHPFQETLRPVAASFDKARLDAMAGVYEAAHKQRRRTIGSPAITATVETPHKYSIRAVDTSTLPDKDARAPYAGDNTDTKTRLYAPPAEQERKAWISWFRSQHAPDAPITIDKGPNAGEYLRLTGKSPDGQPDWIIAEHLDYGHAAYIWRRDQSPVDAETALGTTKKNAIKNLCARVVHPPGFDGTTNTEASERMELRLLEQLTN